MKADRPKVSVNWHWLPAVAVLIVGAWLEHGAVYAITAVLFGLVLIVIGARQATARRKSGESELGEVESSGGARDQE